MSRTLKIIDQIFDIKQETKNTVQQEKNIFSYLNNESQIKGLSWFLPDSDQDKAQQLFLRLTEYFEIGLLLCNAKSTFSNSDPGHVGKKTPAIPNENSNLWKLNKSFIFKKHVSSSELKANLIKLPTFDLFKTYKNKTGSILNALGLDYLDDSDFTTVIYRVDENTIYCFLTKQADPWLSLRLEKILKEIRNGLT